jgi:uncharacterized membrane protein YgcG
VRALKRLGSDNGVVMVIVFASRTGCVKVSTGLERTLSDEFVARVVREQLGPAFREKKYAKGIEAVFERLTRAASDNVAQ